MKFLLPRRSDEKVQVQPRGAALKLYDQLYRLVLGCEIPGVFPSEWLQIRREDAEILRRQGLLATVRSAAGDDGRTEQRWSRDENTFGPVLWAEYQPDDERPFRLGLLVRGRMPPEWFVRAVTAKELEQLVTGIHVGLQIASRLLVRAGQGGNGGQKWQNLTLVGEDLRGR